MRLPSILARFAVPLALTAALVAPVPAAAQDGATVYARGLNAPRGIVYNAASNSLIVSDAGRGGDIEVETPIGPAMLGMTGVIYSIGRNGQLTPLIQGLPSVAARGGAEVSGVHGLALDADHLFYVTDGHGPFEMGFGGLYQYNLRTRQTETLANIAAFEAIENPDGLLVDSNPYGVAVGPDGSIYVVDAGANTVLWVGREDGAIIPIAVVPPVAAPFPNPERLGAMESDPVPTGVAFQQDGTAYISLLTGFPFANGASVLWRATWEGEVSEAATGLTLVTGVAVGPDDRVYVIEMAQGFDLTTTPPGFIPNSGRVLRVADDGSFEVVADGLNFPTAIGFSPAGDLFVGVNGAFSAPGSAEIWTWPGVARAQ